ncbi:murein hydrolase activator EnvC family protein [Evansella cellulosilytica]|uniref:Peptidase M23 n=1 Tax=Evansella cellulosilytica (strain ATCC 21833 / DSM 2522 / FERM P-1141 / JCM 9156 / N-4) TaxID=649639 RepID=E6TYY2_EVAC2|nr:peptidoglycan DD-metalloendopeptidase family protein [Evansella cellulosilytica]ADU31317.1 Peptidase M23 [Evansella cellulosilytica DSM 2522]
MNNRNIILLFTMLIALSTLTVLTFQVVEANEEDLERKIESYQERQGEIDREAEEANRELETIKQKIKQAYNEFQVLDEKAVETKKLINEKEIEMDETEERIEVLHIEIEELEERIAQRDELLKDRVRSMYQTGGIINYIEVILGSKSFGDLIERVSALTTIARQDRNILEQHVADKEALDMAFIDLESQLTSLEEQRRELQSLLQKIEDKLQEKEEIVEMLEKQQIDVEDFIVSYEEEKTILKNQEAAAKAELKRLEEDGNKKTQPSQTSNRSTLKQNNSGTLMWPTLSKDITSPYGPRIHPVRRTEEFHHGIDISRNRGTDIFAAESGSVIEARYMGGYGNTIMLSHVINGQTITTLYAHLDSIHVRVGQRVERGEQIAVMGTTGVSTGVHLHFEVHEGGWNGQKSNSVDPLNYLN